MAPLRDFPIPGILFFTSGNPFSGSYKGLSYRIEPVKGKAEENITAHLYVFTWTGEKCSDLSEKRSEAEFSLDIDGVAAAEEWLRAEWKKFQKENV